MWADVDASESLLINYLFGVFLRPGSSEQRKQAVASSSRSLPTTTPPTYPLTIRYRWITLTIITSCLSVFKFVTMLQ